MVHVLVRKVMCRHLMSPLLYSSLATRTEDIEPHNLSG